MPPYLQLVLGTRCMWIIIFLETLSVWISFDAILQDWYQYYIFSLWSASFSGFCLHPWHVFVCWSVQLPLKKTFSPSAVQEYESNDWIRQSDCLPQLVSVIVVLHWGKLSRIGKQFKNIVLYHVNICILYVHTNLYMLCIELIHIYTYYIYTKDTLKNRCPIIHHFKAYASNCRWVWYPFRLKAYTMAFDEKKDLSAGRRLHEVQGVGHWSLNGSDRWSWGISPEKIKHCLGWCHTMSPGGAQSVPKSFWVGFLQA